MQKGFDVVNLHGTASGVIATPYIGENENWWIGNEDTGISARGEKGDPGEIGPQGPQGDQAADLSRIEALEAKIAKLNSDLAIIDYTDQVTAYYDFHASSPLKVVRSGHFVHISFGTVQTNSFAANTQYKILQLPPDVRSTEYIHMLSLCSKVADNAYYNATVSIDSDGNVYCRPSIVANYLHLDIIYFFT